MATFKSIKELEKYLNKQMASVLNDEVAEKVRDIEQKAIDETVYQGYKPSSDGEPWKYERRRDNGGLRDRKNMVSNVNQTSGGVELTVENITKGKDNGDQIAGLIEYGDNAGYGQYDYKTNRDGTAWQYLRPRPFTEKTVETLQRTGEHVEAFKEGMRKRGINIE